MAQSKKTPERQTGGSNKVFYVVGALVVVAGIAWLVASRGGIGSSAGLPSPADFERLAVTSEPDESVGLALGSDDAPVEIVEFADYSCPHCAQLSSFAGKLLRQNYVETADGPVRWVMYEFVLGSFPNTVAASMAARCAGAQDAYWPYHDMLFSRQARWYTSPNPGGVFSEISDDLGLDTGEWRECMADNRYLEEIAAARKYGEALGVNTTPTLFINGERIDLTGVEPYSHIESLIQAELAPETDGEAEAESGGD